MVNRQVFIIKTMGLVFLSLFLGGCGEASFTHTMSFDQGNILSQKMMESTQPGMQKAEIASMLGQPVLINPFQDNYWHYVYNQVRRYKVVNRHVWVVHFNQSGRIN